METNVKAMFWLLAYAELTHISLIIFRDKISRVSALEPQDCDSDVVLLVSNWQFLWCVH